MASTILKPGINDLASQRPDLAAEWNYEKNDGLLPSQITVQSCRTVWWKCGKCGHEWEKSVQSRYIGTKCPMCKAKESVPIAQYDLDGNFIRLFPSVKEAARTVGGTVTPIYSCIYGRAKTSYGFIWKEAPDAQICDPEPIAPTVRKVVSGVSDMETRFPEIAAEWNYEKNNGVKPSEVISGANYTKYWWTCPLGHDYQATLVSRTFRRSGCPYCAGKIVLPGFNDLESQNPELAEEWDYEHNDGLLPSQVTLHSGTKVWWKCRRCGYFWYTAVYSRANGAGCPGCAKNKNKEISRKARPVDQYDTDGNLVASYRTISIASECTGMLTNTASGMPLAMASR